MIKTVVIVVLAGSAGDITTSPQNFTDPEFVSSMYLQDGER